MIKTILVPLDGSPLAESVLPYAVEIGRRARASLLLLTAIDEVGAWSEFPTKPDEGKETARAQAYLEAKRRQLEAQGLEVRTEIAYGPPAEEILERAANRDAGLIAMSTHGRSGISRWIMGSVADKVLHGTHRPLLLVRATGQEQKARSPEIRRILVPLDGSPLAESVLPFVVDLARIFKASLTLFHAVTPVAAYPGLETAQVRMGDVLDALQSQAEQFLTQVARRLEGQGIGRVDRLVSVGFTVDQIVGAASQAQADLIALATHGRSGLGRWIMGSVANAVVCRTNLPCLVIRPKEAG